MTIIETLIEKTLFALNDGFNLLSTSEQLAAALVLNRTDWLASMNYTIPEALERIGPEWVTALPDAARAVGEAARTMTKAQQSALEEHHLEGLIAGIDLNARLITYGDSPGYRTASFTFDVQRLGSDISHRISLNVNPWDGESIIRHLKEVHAFAWRNGAPIDMQPGERRPHWLD